MNYVPASFPKPVVDLAAETAAAAAQATADAALPKAGGTMTGKIVLDGDPTASLHPATRQYVLSQIAAVINGAPGALDTLKEIADQLASDESAAAALTGTVTGKLSAASNLSDLVNVVVARANLGLGSAATHAVGDFEAAGTVAAEAAARAAADASLQTALSTAIVGSLKGAYSGGTTYGLGDLVTAGGGTYISLANANVGNSLSDTSKWTPLALKGDAAYSQTQGPYSTLPNAAVVGSGGTYFANDLGALFESDGAAWKVIAYNLESVQNNGAFFRCGMPRGMSRDNLAALSSGVEYLRAVPLFDGDGVTGAFFTSSSTAWVQGTGSPHLFFTLRKPDGTLVATTADTPGSAWATSSALKLPFAFDATGAALVPPYNIPAGTGGMWYVGIVAVPGTGGNVPTLAGISTISAVMKPITGNQKVLALTNGSGLTGPASVRTNQPGPLNFTGAGVANNAYAGCY